MRKFMFCLFALLGVLLTFNSCDNDDGYSTGTYYLDYATRENSDDNVVFRGDNGDELIIVSTLVLGINTVEEGHRVYMSYTILGAVETETVFGKAYYVRLNDYRKILTKPVILEADATEDEQVNDPIVSVVDAWFRDDFLNIKFLTPYAVGSTTPHLISLIQGVVAEDGYLDLYLHQNSNGDKPMPDTSIPFFHPLLTVSFDISSVVLEGQTSAKIRFNWTEYEDSYDTNIDKSDTGTFILPNLDDDTPVPPPVVRMSSFARSTSSSFEDEVPVK